MTKEEEILNYLDSKIFTPIVESEEVPKNIKNGIRITRSRMKQLSAEKMVEYYWHSIIGTENNRSINFAELLKENNLVRFEDVMEEFRVKFGNEFIRSK